MNSLNDSCLGFNPCDAQNASSKTKQPLSNLQAYVIPPSMANDNVSFSSANAIRACFFLICSRRYSHQREAKSKIRKRTNEATKAPHKNGYSSLNGIFSRNTFLTQTNLRHCIPVYDILFPAFNNGYIRRACAM